MSPSPSPSPRPASGWRRERRRPLLGGSKRESPPSPATNWQTSLWRWNSNYKVGGENGARGREGVAVAEGRRTRWSQTLWCKIHQSNSTKQITGNFLGATSTHGVPSACIPRNLDQRDGHFPFHHPFLTNQTPLAPSPRPLFRNIAPFIPAFHTSALSVAPDEYRILAAWPVASVLLNPPPFSLPTCLRTYVAHLEWDEAGFRCSSRLSNRLRNPCFGWGRIGLEGWSTVFVAWLRFVGRYQVVEGNLAGVRCTVSLRYAWYLCYFLEVWIGGRRKENRDCGYFF